MVKKLITQDGYKQLVKKIQSELSELDFLIKRRSAEAYWRTGKFIHEHLLEHKDRADYGTTLFEKLADDVGRSKSTLQRAVQFYRTYPIVGESRQFTWNHYRYLITVKDKAKRETLEKKALEREWTAEKLEEVIRLEKIKIEDPCTRTVQGKPESPAKLSVTRSRLYTYQVLEPSYIHPIEEYLTIDLGFNFLVHSEMKGLKLKSGELVESVKLDDSYKFKHSDATKKELYTYKALVERVVDGDTIYLNIDLGFSSWYREKVRLRGIDTPEMATREGVTTKEYVEAKLKTVDFVVVKSYKSDKYERYLVDLFYLEDEQDILEVLSKGNHLNQELLDNGLACAW